MYTVIQDTNKRLRAIPNKRLKTFGINRLNRIASNPTVAANKLLTVSSEVLKSPGGNSTINDVVNDYNWKTSPNNNIIEHPYIYLREYFVNKSTLLSQLLYNLQTISEGAAAQAEVAVQLPIGQLINIFSPGVAQRLRGFISEGVTDITGSGLGLAVSDPINTTKDDYLTPFLKLYSVEPTLFEYKLPFFVEKIIDKKRNWSKSFAGGENSRTGATGAASIVEDQVKFVAEAGTGAPLIGPLLDQGSYVERSKYFSPSRQSEPITFSFPLLNTLDEKDIQKNFDLVWLLCFQNTAVRSNIADITPPCIYEVWIPGIKYMLFAALEDIRIEYLGNRRRVEMVHPGSKAKVDIIIPEAYNINITVNSLTTDSSNFMFKALEKPPA
jgi:hypothetical protein